MSEIKPLYTRKKLHDINRTKVVIVFAAAAALVYLSWWFTFTFVGNPVLYGVLLVGEIYYVSMTFGYWFTVWDTSFNEKNFTLKTYPSIDIYIPVCGEPIEVIKETLEATLNIKYEDNTIKDYPEKAKVYILNDGFVAKKENWREVDNLSKEYPVHVITRQIPGGAKAGNINNALKITNGKFLAVFDADMKSYPEFLQKTIGYFKDKKMAFVQTPQYYENHGDNYVTGGAWAQQELFFGPICRGKNRLNATFCCGTNVIFRKKALDDAGGFDTANIAEDFSTSVTIHSKGWNSLYYPQILAHGLAPMDLKQYYSQQLRWAKGSIDVFFKNNPIFKPHLTFAQRIQYLLSLGYYMMGLFFIVDAFIPVIYLYTGILPVSGSSTSYLLLFFPYILLIVYVLANSTDGKLNYKALQFSIGSFYIQITALFSSIFNKKISFKVTSKTGSNKKENYARLVWPHIAYTIIGLSAIGFSISKHGINPALITNSSWIIFNIVMISAHIYAAFPNLAANLSQKIKQFNSWFVLLEEELELEFEEQIVKN